MFRTSFLGAAIFLAFSLSEQAVVSGQDIVNSAIPKLQFLKPQWSDKQASEHADRYNDPQKWNQKYLEVDLKTHRRPLPPEMKLMPFPNIVFPAPQYELAGRPSPGLSVGPLSVPSPWKGVATAVKQPFDTEIPEGKTFWDVAIDEPLMYLIASGPSKLTGHEQWALSRSHPHYFFQGSYTSENGAINWVAIRMADGRPIGIVNGRILDLKHGNLILVRQHADGSVRIHQHRTRLFPGTRSDVAAEFDRLLKKDKSIAKFLDG